MSNIVLYIILGLVAGIFSGLLGIGGATILVPVMIFFFGLTQHQAQGTTLALMLPPIGLLAFWTYYKQGYVNVPMGIFVCIGFFIGGLFGAQIATNLSNIVLKRIFGSFLLIVSLYMIFKK